MRSFSRVLSSILLFLPTIGAVYKDEAFQNDWHIALVGPSIPSSTFFHQPVLAARASLIYTLTTRSILAAIYPKDGTIVWRHQLGGRCTSRPGIARAADGVVVASVDGSIKAFDAVDGRLIWGKTFGRGVRDLHLVREGVNFVIALFDHGHVVKMNAMTGSVEWETPTPEEKDEPHSLSLRDSGIFVIYLQPSKSVRVAKILLDSGKLSSTIISAFVDPSGIFYGSDQILAWTEISTTQLKFFVPGSKKPPTSVAMPKGAEVVAYHSLGSTILVHSQAANKSWADVYDINVHEGTITRAYSLSAKAGRSAFSISGSGGDTYITWTLLDGEGYLYGSRSSDVLASWAAKPANNMGTAVLHTISEVIPKGEGKYAVRSFVSTSAPGFHGNTHLVLNGDLSWSRLESLSSITASAWVELLDPAAEEVAGELDVEGHKSIGGAYVHRVMRHMSELVVYGPDWLTGIPGRVMDAFLNNEIKDERGGKWRDFFGFRKYVVVGTKEGGLAALDVGKKGASVWETSILSGQNPEEWEGIQRIYEVAKGVVGIVTFGGEYLEVDAFGGEIMKRENLGALVKSSTILERDGGSELLLVVLEGEKVALLPSTSSLGKPAYLTIRGDDGEVKGLRITSSLELEQTWAFTLPASEEIASIATRPSHDPIASIGKVLGDRSVMYKYVNQNLLSIVTSSALRSTASVYVLDSVSGIVLYSARHTGVDTTKPIVSTMSENWIVYSYYGDETLDDDGAAKGYHLVVSELFESELTNDRGPLGKASNYSSIAGQVGRPFAVSQSYIFPSEISFLGVTSTRQGITTREVLALLPWSSSILSLPKRLLDPRRPVNRDPNEAEREEGLLKYIPALEADPKAIINHMRELMGIRNIVTTPTMLESTSLVFAYGGDLFGTRVTPSMPFDVLGKGFSKIQLVGTIVALSIGVGVVAPMVRRKQINQRWLGVS